MFHADSGRRHKDISRIFGSVDFSPIAAILSLPHKEVVCFRLVQRADWENQHLVADLAAKLLLYSNPRVSPLVMAQDSWQSPASSISLP